MAVELDISQKTLHEAHKPEDVEDESLSSYCPDFSDMYDEQCKFWDFLNNSDNVKNAHFHDKKKMWATTNHLNVGEIPENIDEQNFKERFPNFGECEMNLNGLTMRTEKNLQLNKEKSFPASRGFWDFLNSKDGNANKYLEESSDFPPISQSNFWDFLGSPAAEEASSTMVQDIEYCTSHEIADLYLSSKELNHYEDASFSSKHDENFSNHSQSIKAHQLYAKRGHTYTKFSNATLNSDNFWDFLNTNTSTPDYKEVLYDVISSTVTSPCTELPFDTESPCQSISNNLDLDILDKNEVAYLNCVENSKQTPSDNQLPCISSVFSIKPYPNQHGGLDDKCSSQAEVIQCTKPEPVNVISAEKHQLSLKRKSDKTISDVRASTNVTKKKSLRKLTVRVPNQSHVGCSQFVVSDSDLTSTSTSNTGSLRIRDATTNLEQKQYVNISAPVNYPQYINSTLEAKPNCTIVQRNEAMKPLPITIEKVGVNNISNDGSKPLYLVLQNSETLRNPNYSHFFLIMNNNTPNTQQVVLSRSSEVATGITSATSVKETESTSLKVPNNAFESVSTNNNQQFELLKARDSRKVSLSKEEVNAESINSDVESINSNSIQPKTIEEISSEKNKCLAGFRNKYVLNTNKRKRGIEMQQSLSDDSKATDADETKCEIPLSSQPLNTDYFNSISDVNGSLSRKKYQDTPNISLKVKNPKPIKNIPLGKHKNAIQQINTPVKLNDSFEIHESLKEEKNIPHNLCREVPNSSKNLVNGSTINQQTTSKSATFGFEKPYTTSNLTPTLMAPALTSSGNNINLLGTQIIQLENASQASLSQTDSNSIFLALNNHSAAPSSVANQNPIQANVSIYNNSFFSAKDRNPAISTVIASQPSQHSRVIMTSSQSNTFDTIQELFPPPISMMPVCVIPSCHTSSQPTVSKVLILQGSNQNKIIPPKLQELPPRKGIKTSQKVVPKVKKVGRKTVRELLQERQQSFKYKGIVEPQVTRREIRVLRPLCKIPCASDLGSNTLSFTSVNPSTNSTINVSMSSAPSKRPNILILPSASKSKETFVPKNVLEDIQARRDPFIVDVSPIDISILPSSKSSASGKCLRPRYYDMSELQIGYFKVEDDVDACGRFRSKFKVIFTKRQFLYDFPVSRCNQPDLKTSHVWEQMARIAVPFKTITSISMKDRIIYLSVNCAPNISLGTIKARSGMLFNATVYDTLVDSDSVWGNFLHSCFSHKVVLRKRQASKLKASLCQFDRRFISLMSITLYGNQARNDRDPYLFGGGEQSPSPPQKAFAKSRKSCIRRLPQWDYKDDAKEKSSNEEDLLLNQMCSCRTKCQSVRCSCVKAAKSCGFSGSVCQCINCNNPLNVLESIGMDIEYSLSDSCLFQNIYQIPELLNYLQREVRLECCNSFARVQDCIPGTVLCPNINCDAQLQYSWCQRMISYVERNPRNHCSFCGQCCFSNKCHCHTCKRCYAVSSSSVNCPTCQKNVGTHNSVNMEANKRVLSSYCYEDKMSSKQSTKPEIVVLHPSSSSSNSSRNVGEKQHGNKAIATLETTSEKAINGQLLIQNLEKLVDNDAQESASQTCKEKDSQSIKEEMQNCVKIETNCEK